MGVLDHFVVRVRLHQWNDPLSDSFAPMHFSEDVLDVDTIVCKQVGKFVAIGGLGAVIANSLKVLVLAL
jgi:hypothetical protein